VNSCLLLPLSIPRTTKLPQNLHRNEDDRKVSGELVRARPVRKGGCRSQALSFFCTAAAKNRVFKSYL